jgi:hypothetical protein
MPQKIVDGMRRRRISAALLVEQMELVTCRN